MLKKFFGLAFFIIFTLAAIVVYHGHTDDWPANNNLTGSVYASTHGFKNWDPPGFLSNGSTSVHVHCIAAAHWDRNGYYNLHAKIEEADNAPWWVFGVEMDDDSMSTYEGGCREFAEVNNTYTFVQPDHLVYKARAFIKDTTTGATDGEYNQDGMVMED